MFVHYFYAPHPPPPCKPAKCWISSWISIKKTSNRIANTQPKLRTNPPKIANKQNYEQTGVSDMFEALGQIRAKCVFSPIRIEIRVIRVQSSLLSHFRKVDSQKKRFFFFKARIDSQRIGPLRCGLMPANLNAGYMRLDANRARETYTLCTWVVRNLAPYRIGNAPTSKKRARIHQKYRKSYLFEYFWCIFGLFWGLLCFPIL